MVGNIRFAHVPTTACCAYCISKAAKGFIYATVEEAMAIDGYHDNCSCLPVPITAKDTIEGYDLEGIRERQQECEATIKDTTASFDEWRASGSPDTYSQWLAKQTIKEMATRRLKWLLNGEVLPASVEEGAFPNRSEKETAALLAQSGFAIRFRKTRSKQKKRTSDVFLGNADNPDDKKGLEAWEFKHPTGNGKQVVAHQFEEGAGQSSRLVIDITTLLSHENWPMSRIRESVSTLINWHWKTKTGSMQFDEVLTVWPDGLNRYSRSK